MILLLARPLALARLLSDLRYLRRPTFGYFLIAGTGNVKRYKASCWLGKVDKPISHG